MNATLKNLMIEFYNTHAYTHHYIFGFRAAGNIWFVLVTAEILPELLKLDKAGADLRHGTALRGHRAHFLSTEERIDVFAAEKDNLLAFSVFDGDLSTCAGSGDPLRVIR